MNQRFRVAALFILLINVLLPCAAVAATLTSARIIKANEKQQFIFDVSGAVNYQAFALSNPNRLVIDLKNTEVKAALSKLNVQGTVVNSVRSGYFSPNVVRVVFDLKQQAKWQVKQTTGARSGQQLVLELFSKSPSPSMVVSNQSHSKSIAGVAAKPSETIKAAPIQTVRPRPTNATVIQVKQPTQAARQSAPVLKPVVTVSAKPKQDAINALKKPEQVQSGSAQAATEIKTSPLTAPATQVKVEPPQAAVALASQTLLTPIMADAKPAQLRDIKLPNRGRDIVVAIDAGHGGKDTGAIGYQGTKEKDVVLAIARELHKQMSTVRGLKPVLVRDGDYFIHLKKRRDIAREKYKADVFISVHADAFTNRKAAGASVFVLSQNGASSTTASYLADRENSADLIEGFDISNANQSLSEVILNVAMDGVLAESNDVGGQVLKELGVVSRLHKKQVEHAGFMVLKSPDMLSLLVETGFISNPGEEKMLKDPSHQRNLARAIVKGAHRYFENNPIPGTYYAMRHEQRFAQASLDATTKPSLSSDTSPDKVTAATLEKHIVAKGETLSGIASRYRVSTADLKRLNGMQDDKVTEGKVLRIPQA